jgi:glycosyltransferase involved in cell wall biosynthesis
MRIPAISVAMSVYNGERFLAPAIESVLAQTFEDFEFLILNDGSDDRSAAIIDSFAARDPRIRAIHQGHRGLVASLNHMLDEARAPLVARMDCDDICLPNRFERQMAFLAANPDHGVVGTWTSDIDEHDQPYQVDGPDHPTQYEAFREAIATRSALCHPSVIMDKALVQRVGGYHAAFKHCEDYDLWLRLVDLTRLSSLPERLVLYRHTEGQVSNRHAVTQQYGVVVSRLAYQERQAGRADPTEHLDALPPIEQLDHLFGRNGVVAQARAALVGGLLYSKAAMTGDGVQSPGWRSE